MTARDERSLSVLTMRVEARLCGVPLEYAMEVMRPLPLEQLPGAPAFVLGLAVIRGQATPVIDLAALLADRTAVPSAAGRFVTLRTGSRAVALQVEAVLAIRSLDRAQLAELPRLWLGANTPAVAMLGRLDHDLLFVLETARILPETTRSTREVANESERG